MVHRLKILLNKLIASYIPSIGSDGFTLIELLVVIAIIGILATGVLVAINPVGQLIKTRNTLRKATLKQLADAIDRYRVSYGRYPISGTYCAAPGSSWPNCGADWIPGLIASGEIKSLPKDPREGQSFAPCNVATYTYYIYVSDGTDYKLMAYCGLEGTPPSSDPMLDPVRPTTSWAVGTPTGMTTW